MPSAPDCVVSFHAADLFVDAERLWLDADIVWITATCFPQEWFAVGGALTKLILRLKPGARICLLTHSLTGIPGLRSHCRAVHDLAVSWGSCIARCYVRIDELEDSDES